MIGGILHMIAVRLDLMKFLTIPISEKWFGRNKTWRGFVVMPLASQLGLYLTLALPLHSPDLPINLFDPQLHWLGWVLGFFYVLFELPNSWMKRRLGIAPGKIPDQQKFLFILLDRLDSVAGVILAYALFTKAPASVLVFMIFVSPGIQFAVVHALYRAGLRQEPY